MAKFTFLRKMDSWIAAEGDMGQLESLHTCPAGEGLLALQGLGWGGSSPGHPELCARMGQQQLPRAQQLCDLQNRTGQPRTSAGSVARSSPCQDPRSWAGELEGNQAGSQTCLAGSENPTWFLSVLQKMSYSPKQPS